MHDFREKGDKEEMMALRAPAEDKDRGCSPWFRDLDEQAPGVNIAASSKASGDRHRVRAGRCEGVPDLLAMQRRGRENTHGH